MGLECGARSDHEHGDEVGRDLAVTIDGVSAVAFDDRMDELRSGGSREYEILISVRTFTDTVIGTNNTNSLSRISSVPCTT